MVGARIKGERVDARRYRPFSEITLRDGAPHALIVEAYCLDFDKDNPRASSRFVMCAPRDVRVGKLLSKGLERSIAMYVIQAALWMDRDKPTARALKQRFQVDDDIEHARRLQ